MKEFTANKKSPNLSYYLATTGLSDIWDMDKGLLILGPWCLTDENNKKLLEHKNYTLVPSPWKPAVKLKEAADYCYDIYEKLLPQLCESLNSIHQVSYPVRYWRVLLGHWLLYFIEVLYDRYRRIEATFEAFPHFYTYVLPTEQCKLAPFDMYDFFLAGINSKIREDYYNLKLFSLVAYDICPNNIKVREYNYDSKINIATGKYNWRRRLFNKLIESLDSFFKCPIVLCDMYHLSPNDMVLLKLQDRFKTFRFMHLELMKESFLKIMYSHEIRNMIKLKGNTDRFQSLLYRILPEAIPMCYVENYKSYQSTIKSIKNIDSVKIVGSAVAWTGNERFKFFAAEAVSRGAKLIDFQHGAGYGVGLALPQETLSLEKDIFYTWGWKSIENNSIRPLPSPHLSRLMKTYTPEVDSILFVGTSAPRYYYITQTGLLPDDMPKYFEDKRVFFQALQGDIKDKILYRPSIVKGWREIGIIKKACPDVHFVLEGKLVNWMKKVKLVVIDHPRTSFIEALTINCPSVFYWDHEVFLMRPEAEEYFNLLRDAGILFKDPLSAAEKVKQIFNDPISWWLQDNVQNARMEFCRQYAYARRDWMEIWVKELNQLLTRPEHQ